MYKENNFIVKLVVVLCMSFITPRNTGVSFLRSQIGTASLNRKFNTSYIIWELFIIIIIFLLLIQVDQVDQVDLSVALRFY